jgi:hypothetical protein
MFVGAAFFGLKRPGMRRANRGLLDIVHRGHRGKNTATWVLVLESVKEAQLTDGGKKMPQKWGEGDVNSTGTSEPSWPICIWGGRTTRASTLPWALGIFDDDDGSFRKRLRNNQHGSAGADGMSITFESVGLADDLNHDTDPEEGALRAAALFGRGRTRRDNFRSRGDRFHVRWRCHSSSPQKSISGATSSTPYSQPSGRGTPRQTTTAALLVSVARFVSARRCSSASSCSRTTIHPYGLTTRV